MQNPTKGPIQENGKMVHSSRLLSFKNALLAKNMRLLFYVYFST